MAVIGRPEKSEAAPYYFTYIDRVADDDIVRVLSGQLEETLALFSQTSEDDSLYRPAEDKWSIRQTLSHLADAERVMAFRAFWFARGFESALPSFDQNVAARAADADPIPWAAHLEEFRRVRLSTVTLFENMSQDAWTRGGVASDNYFTVRSLAFLIAGHLKHHLDRLQRRDSVSHH
ncbi:MAG TPA: DinB family protein [Bryobacteraceae bacterium]|nr:DinB family protein [Bryobacteraceae bacterium]